MKFLSKVKSKIKALSLIASTAIMMSPITAFAVEGDEGGGSANPQDVTDKATGAMDGVLGLVCGAFGVIGAAFAFIGIWKVANAFRNDNNPEAISSGAKDLVVGGIFIAIAAIGWGPLKGALGI